MPETTRITVEKSGEDIITLWIDPAEPAISLAAIIERAELARGAGSTTNSEAPPQVKAGAEPAPMLVGAEPHELIEKLRRISEGEILALERDEAKFLLKWAEPQKILGRQSLTPADLEALMSLPGRIHEKASLAPRDLDSDLEDVLDSYRLAGRMCGVQVLAVGLVVSWIGDIQSGLAQREWRAWGPQPDPVLLHQTHGANALEDAAKWLRSQLDEATWRQAAHRDATANG